MVFLRIFRQLVTFVWTNTHTQSAEVKNGRLAMIGIFFFLSSAHLQNSFTHALLCFTPSPQSNSLSYQCIRSYCCWFFSFPFCQASVACCTTHSSHTRVPSTRSCRPTSIPPTPPSSSPPVSTATKQIFVILL